MPTPSDLSDSGAVDAWLGALLRGDTDASSEGDREQVDAGDVPGICLLAVGSYGRRDHAPHSDLDLVLIHNGRADVAAMADRLWYPIWDAGLGLDHSVRTPKEALAVAAGDLKAALGLLEARVVAGDPSLGAEVIEGTRRQWVKRAKQFLPALAVSVRDRHRRFGEVAFLLEPDLKEGQGGLRDVQAIKAAALAMPELAERLGPLEGAEAVLLRVRHGLHRRAGRSLDRLLLEEQDQLAAELGFIGADELMAAVSEAARAVSYLGEDTWRRVGGARTRGWSGRWVQRLPDGMLLRNGEVAASGEVDVRDPALPLLAATVAADHDATISRELLVELEAHTPVPPVPWPQSLRDALVALLERGHRAIGPIEALDHHGLLSRLIPEWAAVRHRPQRNAYHRFTVDRHLLETAANAAELPTAAQRRDLLLLGALLHDIGKGFPGDHTDAGIEVVARLGARMGFSSDDAAVLVGMVRHHLLLADTATRRDVQDPATAAAVAAALGDAEMVHLLTSLTHADSLATGSAAWSEWKAGLIGQLVEKTLAVMRADGGDDLDTEHDGAGEVIHEADGLAPGVHGVGMRCLVVADDRPGMLSAVAGVLALHGLDVLGARVGSRADGQAVEVIDVEPAYGRQPDWRAVAADVERSLAGALVLSERLEERARQYGSHARPKGRTVPTGVTIDNRATGRATVVEVRAANGIGVLHRITGVLSQAGMDIRWARVSTLGDEVVDTFYLVDAATGAKVFDADRLGGLETALIERLVAGG